MLLGFTAIISASLSSCEKQASDDGVEISNNIPVMQVAEGKAVERIACGSCYRPTSKNAEVWDTIASTKPELFLFMGDNIYADTEDMQLMKEKYDKLLKLPSFKKFSQQHTILPIWDDHDYGANDAGVEYPKKAESQQIFLDTFGFAKDHPARKQEGIYHSYMQGPEGKRLQVINLDTRYHRSPIKKKKVGKLKVYLPNTDPKATMLGEAQWKWLEQELQKPADLRIIVSSIQIITVDHGYEKWANIPAERKRLFDLLKKTNAKHVVLLSGDRHLAEFSRIKPEESGLDYDVVEMTSSGMTHANAWNHGNSHRIEDSYFSGKNFGTIEIDWSKPSAPEVTLNIMKLGKDKAEVFRSTKIKFE